MQVDTLAVYWSARVETAEACAERCSTYLKRLADQYAQLGLWYEKGVSSEMSVNDYSLDMLTSLVAKGTNKRDVGGQAMEELGFRISLWNHLPEDSAIGLSIKCGLYSTNPKLKNSVVMQLPAELKSVGLDGSNLKDLLTLTAEVWGAEWGAVFHTNSNVVLSRQSGAPFLDKILWLQSGYAFEATEYDVTEEVTAKGRLLICRSSDLI